MSSEHILEVNPLVTKKNFLGSEKIVRDNPDKLVEIDRGPLISISCKTTGLYSSNSGHRIIQFSAMYAKYYLQPTDSWLFTLNPEMSMSSDMVELNGLSNEHLSFNGMNYLDGLTKISELMTTIINSGCPMSTYNAPYLLTALRSEFLLNDIKFDKDLWDSVIVFDPMVVDKEIDKYRAGKRTLEEVSRFYGHTQPKSNYNDPLWVVRAVLYISRVLANKDSIGSGISLKLFNKYMKTGYVSQKKDLARYFRSIGDGRSVNTEWPYRKRSGL